ncbi:hypothetical protein WMY93_012971 [Mugilogobius chulae]|uniref:Transmembrane channel-like protein n=1 Tax=Mugilogobius chulae TaxID=88201 RepID=A0AAW0P2E0_9GOBI
MLKLSIIDMIFTVASICSSTSSEPEYGEFKIAENVLHLIYNQGMIWMGAFFSPCLPAFNVLKLIGLMYLRSWAVLTCNVPHQQVFRASSGQEKIYDIISETVEKDFPLWFGKVMSYVTSPIVVLPALLLLFMLIYYLQSIARSLKFTNNQLRLQLQTERTDDKKKVFQMAAARLQAPESTADPSTEQQESDITSHEASIQTPSPRRNGSVTNFQTPVRRGNSIRTISQSASRADLNHGGAPGTSRSPSVSILPKHRLEHRLHHSGASSSCRPMPYHQVVYSPRVSDHLTSEPVYRKTIHAIHPVERIITAQSFGSRRGHTTRYVIVNEHEPRKHLLRSATRVPRHYLMEEPAEIVELYPRNFKRYTARAIHHQPHIHRAHQSQQNMSEEEDEEEQGPSTRRRMPLGKTLRPKSLSDLNQPAHFYIGERAKSHSSMSKGPYEAPEEEEEEEEEDREVDWDKVNRKTPLQAKARGAEQVSVRTRKYVPSSGRHCGSPSRGRHVEPHVKPKTRPKLETPLTESDSASVASSSDQQNSSVDQYIQVIHNKERFVKADARHGKLAKKKSKTTFDPNVTEVNDLVCSNV